LNALSTFADTFDVDAIADIALASEFGRY